jgi:hypothetical protein
MWLYTKFGFFSIVKKRFGDQFKPFQVRARSESDLKILIKKASLEDQIIYTPNADYHYRITADIDELESIMHQLLDNLDYDNFKNMIAQQPEQKNKLGTYHEVWNSMYKYQKD